MVHTNQEDRWPLSIGEERKARDLSEGLTSLLPRSGFVQHALGLELRCNFAMIFIDKG